MPPSDSSDSPDSRWYVGLPVDQLIAGAVDRMRHRKLTAAEEDYLTPMFTMLGARDMPTSDCISPKWASALELMRHNPEAWFRDAPMDDRDRELLDATTMPCFDLGQTSYLKKICHKAVGKDFEVTSWTVENDQKCRRMIRQAGSEHIGFNAPPATERREDWQSMKLDVNVTGDIAPGVTWSLLCTKPTKTRLMAGPSSTCAAHPWDAMILRDCYAGTDRMSDIPRHGTRVFDVLLMKMCEDFDNPWVMVAVKDSGPYVPTSDCYAL